MTVQSTYRRAGPFSGNGVATTYPFDFKVFQKSDVRVVRTTPLKAEEDLVLDSDYSVTLNLDQDADPGGTVTYPRDGSPLPTGWRLTVVSALAFSQLTDITNAGRFNPDVVERAFDRGVILLQQIQEEVSRAVRIPVSSTGTPEDLIEDLLVASTTVGAAVAQAQQAAGQAIEAALALTGSQAAGIVPYSSLYEYAASSVGRKLRDVLSVTDAPFNADPKGLVDATAAFQAAFDEGALHRREVYIPDGTFLLSSKIIATGAVSIRGASRSTAKLIWPATAASEGIEVNVGGASGISHMTEISRLQLLSGNPSATGTALHVVCSNTLSPDRFTSRAIVRDIVCRGLTHPFTDGWGVGVDLGNCSNSLIDCITFWGRIASTGEPNYVSENAIAYNGAGTPHACAVTITNNFLIYAKTGIRLYDFEGALVRGNQVLGVNTGLVVDNPNLGGYNYPHCSALDNHFNASTACITVNRTAQFMAMGNLLYLQLGAFTGSGIDILGGSNHFSIQGNIFECLKTNYGMNSVVVSSGTSGVIAGNVIRRANGVNSGAGAGVWLTSGSSLVKAGDNLIEGTSTPYIDEGTNNKVAHSGIVGPRFWESSLEGVISQWGTEVITLNASGDGVITLPTPFKIAHQVSMVANGDPGTLPTSSFVANQPACTLTTLAFSVRPNPGAGPCRVNWMSKGR